MKNKEKGNIIKVRPKADFANVKQNKTYMAVRQRHGIIKVLNDNNMWVFYHDSDFTEEGEDNVNTIQK